MTSLLLNSQINERTNVRQNANEFLGRETDNDFQLVDKDNGFQLIERANDILAA